MRQVLVKRKLVLARLQNTEATIFRIGNRVPIKTRQTVCGLYLYRTLPDNEFACATFTFGPTVSIDLELAVLLQMWLAFLIWPVAAGGAVVLT